MLSICLTGRLLNAPDSVSRDIEGELKSVNKNIKVSPVII